MLFCFVAFVVCYLVVAVGSLLLNFGNVICSVVIVSLELVVGYLFVLVAYILYACWFYACFLLLTFTGCLVILDLLWLV